MEREHEEARSDREAGLDRASNGDATASQDLELGGAEIVRSEEVLSLGLSTQVSERVVVRKRVVTETVTQVVERRREELVIERHPVDSRGTDRSQPTDTEHGTSAPFVDADFEITLFEEEILITKQIVPVEKITLGTRTVTDVVEVTDDVRREAVDVISDPLPPTGPT